MFDIICNYTLYYTKTYFRYYLCTSCNDWETVFVSFKQTDESSTKLTLKMEISRNLSLDEQQALLMILPNHHKWPFLTEEARPKKRTLAEVLGFLQVGTL